MISQADFPNEKKDIMGIDQYGYTYCQLGRYPRKELLARLGRRRASRMYIDDRKGNTIHIGYVIGDRWITLYNITPWEKEISV